MIDTSMQAHFFVIQGLFNCSKTLLYHKLVASEPSHACAMLVTKSENIWCIQLMKVLEYERIRLNHKDKRLLRKRVWRKPSKNTKQHGPVG